MENLKETDKCLDLGKPKKLIQEEINSVKDPEQGANWNSNKKPSN